MRPDFVTGAFLFVICVDLYIIIWYNDKQISAYTPVLTGFAA